MKLPRVRLTVRAMVVAAVTLTGPAVSVQDDGRGDPRPAGRGARLATLQRVVVDLDLEPRDLVPQSHTPSI